MSPFQWSSCLSPLQRLEKLCVEQRLQFVHSKGLCINCLLPGHFVRDCPKSSFCRISGCHFKHSIYLYPQKDAREAEETSPFANTNGMKFQYQTVMLYIHDPPLACAAFFFAFFPMDFQAKERLLAVYALSQEVCR